MIQRIYCMYDRVADEYGPMFLARNDGCAVRAVKHDIGKNIDNLDDYWLMYIGIYDTTIGKIIPEIPSKVEIEPVALEKQWELVKGEHDE